MKEYINKVSENDPQIEEFVLDALINAVDAHTTSSYCKEHHGLKHILHGVKRYVYSTNYVYIVDVDDTLRSTTKRLKAIMDSGAPIIFIDILARDADPLSFPYCRYRDQLRAIKEAITNRGYHHIMSGLQTWTFVNDRIFNRFGLKCCYMEAEEKLAIINIPEARCSMDEYTRELYGDCDERAVTNVECMIQLINDIRTIPIYRVHRMANSGTDKDNDIIETMLEYEGPPDISRFYSQRACSNPDVRMFTRRHKSDFTEAHIESMDNMIKKHLSMMTKNVVDIEKVLNDTMTSRIPYHEFLVSVPSWSGTNDLVAHILASRDSHGRIVIEVLRVIDRGQMNINK